MNELVSLKMCCYNHEKYIKDAIESVLAQTYDNIEILICDDFSTDRTWEIIQSYIPVLQKRFRRVVVFQNSRNLGVCVSLNKLIAEIKSPIIFSLAGDDMMAKTYVEDIMHVVEKYPEVSVFVSDGYKVEEHVKYSELDAFALTPFYKQTPDFSIDTLFERLYWHNVIFAPGVTLKKEIYDKFGLYDPDIFIEDLEFWLRITRTKETKFLYIDKPLAFYRQSPNSVTSTVKNEHYLERSLRFMDASEKIIDKYGPYVGKDEYIRRKWAFLLDKRTFYKIDIPKEETKFLRDTLYPFIKENWHTLGWKQLVRYYHMYFNALRNRKS